jgi:hypothetical protein
VAFLFVLALLIDSTCAAACIPIELKSRAAEDCSQGHHDSDRESCDLHGHLTPVVKERTGIPVYDAPATVDDLTDALPQILAGLAHGTLDVTQPTPSLVTHSILRI